MKIDASQMDIRSRREAAAEREITHSSSIQVAGTWSSFRDMVDSYRRNGEALPEAVRELPPRELLPESWSSGALASAREERGRRMEALLQQMLAGLLALLTAGPKRDGETATLPDLGGAPPAGAGAAGGEAGSDTATPSAGRRITLLAWERETSLRIRESESTTVCARGSVRTADGRCIDFNLDVAMERQFEAEYRETEKGAGIVLQDPLVLNFDGRAAELSGGRFDFDLDGDGSAESLAGLGRGSAFLALDRNGDGAINNGGELFGAASGNGFADLAAYDLDGNHWIDEADAVYAQLRLWQPGDESGGGRLQDLREAGVGAIWLGSAASEFSLKDGDNQLQAQVRRSGVWLSEAGQAGVVQQVDLAS